MNGPHFLHIYSYVGIDPPAETNLAADQSVAIVGKYTAAIDGLRGDHVPPARMIQKRAAKRIFITLIPLAFLHGEALKSLGNFCADVMCKSGCQ